jgi:hypothetical protein
MILITWRNFGQGFSSADTLEKNNGDASISVSTFANTNMEADQNNDYRVINTVFVIRRRREGIHDCISRASLARSQKLVCAY